jgi:NADPH-dependent 2,4-dienoyl-CoA reductase/sulfur reductase-like enzyme
VGCALSPVPGLPATLWRDTLGEDEKPRAPLPGSAAYDVAIVGAGFTGLWTAYYLARADPTVRIAVLEA